MILWSPAIRGTQLSVNCLTVGPLQQFSFRRQLRPKPTKSQLVSLPAGGVFLQDAGHFSEHRNAPEAD